MAESEPIFKSIFGESWDNLPVVMKKHYANRSFSDDIVTVKGHLDVMCKWYLKPLFRLFGTVPPYNEDNVPVTVDFISEKTSEIFCFNRIFNFKNGNFAFRSQLSKVKGNEVIEKMNYGLCWHSTYSWTGSQIVLEHKGYSLSVMGIQVPLPITWLIGAGGAIESPETDNSFSMSAVIIHPLLGKVYEYKGKFEFIKTI